LPNCWTRWRNWPWDKLDNIALVALSDVDDRVSIPVNDTSSKPSKIKISGIKLTVDRTVPEGDMFIKVGGDAINENQKSKLFTVSC